MTTYRIEVVEHRAYDVLYTVEADSPAEAREMAEAGDTVAEEEIKCRQVTDRELWGEPVECRPDSAGADAAAAPLHTDLRPSAR